MQYRSSTRAPQDSPALSMEIAFWNRLPPATVTRLIRSTVHPAWFWSKTAAHKEWASWVSWMPWSFILSGVGPDFLHWVPFPSHLWFFSGLGLRSEGWQCDAGCAWEHIFCWAPGYIFLLDKVGADVWILPTVGRWRRSSASTSHLWCGHSITVANPSQARVAWFFNLSYSITVRSWARDVYSNQVWDSVLTSCLDSIAIQLGAAVFRS